MIAFQELLLTLNLLTALVFGIAYFVAESPKVEPRSKANAGVLLASLFLAFLVLLSLFAVLSAILKRNALFLALSIFVIIPFILGRLASYRTLRICTVVQILSLLLSAVTLCVI